MHAEGIAPVVNGDLSIGRRDVVKWGPSIQGDILDAALVAATLAEFKPIAVLHFSALALAGSPSLSLPNIGGRMSAERGAEFDAMASTGVDELVVLSSRAVYGEP